ncbi:MAG: hypothetical protein WC222_12145 [Parachlamydiales bacterium]|jgi:hypothetical protein
MSLDSIQPGINYCKENPLFIAGCVASAVANPLLFAATTILGMGATFFIAEEVEGKPIKVTIHGHNGPGTTIDRRANRPAYVFTEINPFYSKISGLGASVLAIACHINKQLSALSPVCGIASKAFSALNGFMLGASIMNNIMEWGVTEVTTTEKLEKSPYSLIWKRTITEI